jgi:hypothetical protein
LVPGLGWPADWTDRTDQSDFALGPDWPAGTVHLGLKPQAGEYPPFQGGPPTRPILYRGTSPTISPSSPSAGYPTPRFRHWAAISGQVHSKRVRA